MPSNSRPGKFFDPIRKNQSIAEIEDAQNQWDLLEAQEEAQATEEATPQTTGGSGDYSTSGFKSQGVIYHNGTTYT